jgi:uncharacterized membrane protein YphA (DoxX/SURF4 family)
MSPHAFPRRAPAPPSQAYGLALLRILAGVFFLFHGIEKVGWLASSQPLADRFAGFLSEASPLNRWYLDRLLPGLPVFARVVVLGELAAGLALITGFWRRLAAVLALALVLNDHLASGAMFRYAFLIDASGLPLVGALLALAMAAGPLPWSVEN